MTTANTRQKRQRLSPMQQTLLASLVTDDHDLYLDDGGKPHTETRSFPHRIHDIDRRTFRALVARNFIATSVHSAEGKQYYYVTRAGRAAIGREGVSA